MSMTKYTTDQLEDLLDISPEKLRQALSDDPNLIKERGDHGETLLHLAARKYWYDRSAAESILRVLFDAPGADFSLKDDDGDTATHVAARSIDRHQTNFHFVFPAFVKKAAEVNFDFSTANNRGLTVLHLSIIITHSFPWGNACGDAVVLEHAKDPAINALSSSGSTALFYAINHLHFVAAENLLNAGANPTKFGAPDRDPFAMIEKYLQEAREQLSEEEPDNRTQIELITKLTSLKQKMLSAAEKLTVTEIRKNARLLGQAARDSNSIFAKKKVPLELLAKIAGHTGSESTKTQLEREKIARKHLSKPKINAPDKKPR